MRTQSLSLRERWQPQADGEGSSCILTNKLGKVLTNTIQFETICIVKVKKQRREINKSTEQFYLESENYSVSVKTFTKNEKFFSSSE